MKFYLGDGVFVEYVENEAVEGIVLTTEDGVKVTNRVFIEGPIFENLVQYVNQIREKYNAKPIIIPKDGE